MWTDGFVPVVNLVVRLMLFWGPFSAKILNVYSVAGSRPVSSNSTVFPDTVRVISGTAHKHRSTHTPKWLHLSKPSAALAVHTLPWNTQPFRDPAEEQVCSDSHPLLSWVLTFQTKDSAETDWIFPGIKSKVRETGGSGEFSCGADCLGLFYAGLPQIKGPFKEEL